MDERRISNETAYMEKAFGQFTFLFSHGQGISGNHIPSLSYISTYITFSVTFSLLTVISNLKTRNKYIKFNFFP